MKIPKNAKRVFKGVIFDVYQWQQKMFDGSYATFEMAKRPNTVFVIPIRGKKIFIGYGRQPQTKNSSFGLFGGRQDKKDKTPLKAAKRELLEESGLSSDNWELIKTYERHSKIEWIIYLFVARDCKKSAEQNLDAGEKIKVKKIGFDEFIKIAKSSKFTDGEFTNDILRITDDEKKLAEFKKKIFGK